MSLEMQHPKATQGVPTQAALPIGDIRDDCIIMTDGTLRAVVAVSSTNFDLKNEDEQNSIIFAYQRFLNALDFPIQILMQSRRLDINSYVEKLNRLSERQTNELLKVQAQTYIEFIEKLVENTNVMTKNFYIIIAYSQSIDPPATGFFSKIFGSGKVEDTQARLEKFQQYAELLNQRVQAVLSNLNGMTVRGMRLDTPALIELLYSSYNFEAGPQLVASKLGDLRVLDSNTKPN